MTQAVAADFDSRREAVPQPLLTRLLATAQGRIIVQLVLVGTCLAIWEYVPFGRGTRLWLSTPSLILSMLRDWVIDGSIWAHLGATLLVMILGYVIGCITGICMGLILGCMPRLSRVLAPYIMASNALPKIALAPLLIIFFGIGIESKVILVAMTVFFLVFNNTLEGVRDIDRDLIQLFNLMGATRVEIIRKVMIPSALPWIFTGMRISVRYAFTNTLLAELIAANVGLGFLIEFYSGNFDTTGAYAAIMVIVVLSVMLTGLLMRTERWALRWH